MANDDSPGPLSHDRALRGLKPVQAAPVLEARTRAARREEFHVVLGRQAKLPSPEVIQAICQGLGWDTWSTIRRLEAPTPRIVRRESSMDSANYWVGWLRELGVTAFAIPESRLADVHVHEAISLAMETDAVVVAASDGTLHRASSDEALCVVFSELRMRTVRSVQMEGRVAQEVVRDEIEGTVDLHLRTGETLLRFRQFVLRYSEFLEGDDSGSMALFVRVRDLLRGALPGIPYYADFHAASGSLGESWRLLSRSREAISRFHGSQALADVEISENSDLALFHLWSVLLRFQHASR